MEFSDVKITVLKKLKTVETLKEYGIGEVEEECPYVKQRQEYISKEVEILERFCSWALAEVHRNAVHLATGGDFPWISKKGIMTSC